MGDAILDRLMAVDPYDVAAWPQSEQDWYHRELTKHLGLQTPATFAVAHSKGKWLPYRHLEFTSDAIVDMIEHDSCDILLVDQPVRHGKSELCSKWTPAWFIAKYPNKRVLSTSYEADFAATWGRKVRDILEDIGDQYGIEIKSDTRAANRWELTNDEGGMGTAGVDGPITGKGGDLCIVDDPVKNKKEADSPIYRQAAWEWFDTTFLSRREPGAKVILIMSRWHIDDLMGRIIEAGKTNGMRIKRLRMPAVAEDDDVLGRTPGEALCPERYDEQALENIRRQSPMAWPALYQQRPVAQGGGMFKRTWIKSFNKRTIDGEDFLDLDGQLVALADCTIYGTMDTAYTKSKRSDYTALGIFAAIPGDPAQMALLHMYRKRVTHAEHAPMLREAWNDYKPRWIGLEKIMATMSLFDEAQRSGIVLRWLKPDRNKVARAETAVALAEQGRVWIPREVAWREDFLEELTTFPSGTHDDMVDVTSYAAAELAGRQVRGHHRKDEHKTFEDKVWDRVKKMQKQNSNHPVLGSF